MGAGVIPSLVRIMSDYPDNEPLVRVNLLALSNLAELGKHNINLQPQYMGRTFAEFEGDSALMIPPPPPNIQRLKDRLVKKTFMKQNKMSATEGQCCIYAITL